MTCILLSEREISTGRESVQGRGLEAENTLQREGPIRISSDFGGTGF